MSSRSTDHPPARTLDAIRGSDGFVLASPIYRASYAHPLKRFLDECPRGMWGESEAPLTARPVALVATGASLHHFLALNELRNTLAAFFGGHVLSPGLYVPRNGFADGADGEPALDADHQAAAELQGLCLVDLIRAVAESEGLARIVPQA